MTPTYTDAVNAEPPKRTRRTKAQIEADDLAEQARHASPTIPLAEFIPILRDWQKRYSACEEAERILQRTCKLKFMARAYDYETGAYPEDDRFTPRPTGNPTDIPKADLVRAIKSVKRTYGNNGHGINWLQKTLETKFGLNVTEYNDTYTMTWKITISAQDLTRYGWEGGENPRDIGEALRYNRVLDYRTGELEIEPDPQRKIDAAAAEELRKKLAAAALAAQEAADKEPAETEPETEETTETPTEAKPEPPLPAAFNGLGAVDRSVLIEQGRRIREAMIEREAVRSSF